MKPGPRVVGELATHAAAAAFAETVRRVHHRYATEVVAEFRLCPFLKDPETAFGAFVVVLSRRADVNLAVRWVLDEEVQVVHLIYPLLAMDPAEFERFGNAVHQGVAASERGGPVHATFHPAMVGDPSAPARLVGFLRRAPDPFIQFIPEGLHEGGSTFIDLESVDLRELVKNAPPPKGANSQSIFERLAARDIETIRATIADIHRDRADSYAEFLRELGA